MVTLIASKFNKGVEKIFSAFYTRALEMNFTKERDYYE